MNSRRAFVCRLPLLAFGVASTPAVEAAKDLVVLKTIEDIKKPFPRDTEWKEVVFQGRKLLFCIVVLPSYGQSYIDVLGWVYRDYLKEWRQVLNVNTSNLGLTEWNVDGKKGVLSVRGAANNELKGVEVVRFDLRAT